jgi:hypothetical protein
MRLDFSLYDTLDNVGNIDNYIDIFYNGSNYNNISGYLDKMLIINRDYFNDLVKIVKDLGYNIKWSSGSDISYFYPDSGDCNEFCMFILDEKKRLYYHDINYHRNKFWGYYLDPFDILGNNDKYRKIINDLSNYYKMYKFQ